MPLETVKLSLESWARYDASNSKKRKRSKTLQQIHEIIVPLRAARKALLPERVIKTPERLDRRRRLAEYDAYFARQKTENDKIAALRKTLLRAARVARKMGYMVQSSSDRDGRISSYYANLPGSHEKMRISDHALPSNPSREYYSDLYGDRPELIIDSVMTETRLRRRIVLAAAYR